MKKEEYHLCSKEKGFCSILEKYTQSNRHTKGLSWLTIMTDSRKFETIGVVYKENNRSNGIMLNHCPFCGEDLRPFRAGYTKKQESEVKE